MYPSWCTTSRGSALDSGLADNIAKLRTAFGHIALLPAQEALIIERSSFCTPHLMQFLRCSPCFDHPLRTNSRTRYRAMEGTVSNHEHTHVQHTMATSQYSCEEWRLGDSTCCVACTSSLLGVFCGHFRSPMLHPCTLPIVRRQGGFHCSRTLAFAHRYPHATGTPLIVSKSLGCFLVGNGLTLSRGSSIIIVGQSQTTRSNSCPWQ